MSFESFILLFLVRVFKFLLRLFIWVKDRLVNSPQIQSFYCVVQFFLRSTIEIGDLVNNLLLADMISITHVELKWVVFLFGYLGQFNPHELVKVLITVIVGVVIPIL